jgi:hypothetical protein
MAAKRVIGLSDFRDEFRPTGLMESEMFGLNKLFSDLFSALWLRRHKSKGR